RSSAARSIAMIACIVSSSVIGTQNVLELGTLDEFSNSRDEIRRVERVLAVDFGGGRIERLELFVRVRRSVAHPGDVGPGKQQLLGIDEPGVEERLRLLGASARVGLVHQAALLVHEAMQVAPRARELL